MIVHTTMIHGRCPINGSWDYYEVEIHTDEFIKCELIELACDTIRGLGMTQEQMAYDLREKFPGDCVIILRGRHGQNIATMVEI